MGNGGVELDYLFANQISSFDMPGSSTVFPEHFASVPDVQQEPTWILSAKRYPDSSCNVFPQIKFQQQSPYQNTKPVHPSFAVPIFSAFNYNHALDSRCNSEFLPFGSCDQLNGLPSFPANRTFQEKMVFPKQEGSSLPTAINGTPMWFARTHGNFSKMAKMTPQEIMEAKALAASKSHSEAERRRRCRINTHLATLRNMLPSTTKTDKASLLAEVIQHLKEVKRKAAEISDVDPVPSDADEVSVEIDPSLDGDCLIIRASLCCDDRPGLLPDLIQTLRSLSLQITKADMSTLGGRVKIAILLTHALGASAKQDGSFLSNVQEALQAVMDKSCSNGISASNFGAGKRQKVGYGNNDLIPF